MHLECREWSTMEIGRNRLVIGTVELLHVRDGVIDPDTFRTNGDQYHPLARMHGLNGYARTRDYFEIERNE